MDVRPDCDWYWARIPEADAEHDENGICLGKEPPMRLDPVPGYDPVRGEIYLSPEDYYSYDIGYLSPPVSRRH